MNSANGSVSVINVLNLGSDHRLADQTSRHTSHDRTGTRDGDRTAWANPPPPPELRPEQDARHLGQDSDNDHGR